MNIRRTRDTRHRPGALADRVRQASTRTRFLARYQNDVHVYRASIAMPHYDNPPREAAHLFQQRVEAGLTDILDASFFPSYGAGGWGVEAGFTLETATPKPKAVARLVRAYLRTYNQECAYVTVDGSEAYEIDADGNISPITGE